MREILIDEICISEEIKKKESKDSERHKKNHPTQEQIVVEINGKLKAVNRWKTEIISCVLFNLH